MRLIAAGIGVTLEIYPGAYHAFTMFAETKAARKFQSDWNYAFARAIAPAPGTTLNPAPTPNRSAETIMPAYVVFTREKTTDADQLAAYAKRSGGTLAGHAVKPLAAYGKHEVLEGAPIEGAVISGISYHRSRKSLV
jgi:hypothetical protein